MGKIISKNGFETTQMRSYTMSRIKSEDTKAELILRKALWKLGYRYTLKNKHLTGKPDLVFPKHNLLVFVDGDFWHGYKWKLRKSRLKSNKKYWIEKIEGNIKRDKQINKKLRKEGWLVFRFWEHNIIENVDKCVNKIVNL